MHLQIATKSREITILSNNNSCFGELMKVKASTRRFAYRSILPIVLILGVLLPLIFIRTAFIVLEGANQCSSANCKGWNIGTRFFWGGNHALELRDELSRVFLESEGETINGAEIDISPQSIADLIADMLSNHQDMKTFALKTKAMMLKMDNKVQNARHQASVYRYLASIGVPKSIHCLSLRLAEEYSINALARSRLPPPESFSRLSNNSYNHIILITDNVLAASVVISSTVKNFAHPNKLVFHIITDRKTYTAMHAWFALNLVSTVVEVKGLHQIDWPEEININLIEIMKIHNETYKNHLHEGKGGNFKEDDDLKTLEKICTGSFSLLKHIRIYLPDLFPNLDKIVFLDDDVVVQQDLSPLWDLYLNGKVNAAVSSDLDEKSSHCIGRRYRDYLNYSNPFISININPNQCSWLQGMNVFDLKAWRKTNITRIYMHWLKINHDAGFALWDTSSLPPALIAFDGHVMPIDRSWHVSGLGSRLPDLDRKAINSAAVVHFSGPAKPWLEIGFPEYRGLWSNHINFSNEFINNCKVMD